ncbi:MAG: cobalt-precorrin-5B (C(1))-methyltransferase [Thermodesulfovibrionales bacterium]
MASKSRKLRTGYTTGACAAAAAKAAVTLIMRNALSVEGNGLQESGSPITHNPSRITGVDIPFPDGSRHAFRIVNAGYDAKTKTARASVIKDAGDDPDVTNNAEIAAAVGIREDGNRGMEAPFPVVINGGKGVGRVTKPGLSVPVGEPAINPVPRAMIRAAVAEAVAQAALPSGSSVEVTISVPRGEELAEKTLNGRLGIVGGISILGTTGIVRPLSAEAWTSSISAAMDVARAMGRKEVVLSTGRVSEKAHQERYRLPVESYVMMGDYVEYSLEEARKHGFSRIHISAHWAKLLKISMGMPQTHVRHGAIDMKATVTMLNSLGIAVDRKRAFNTAREIFDELAAALGPSSPVFGKVCRSAQKTCEARTGGIPVSMHLVSYEGRIVAESA